MIATTINIADKLESSQFHFILRFTWKLINIDWHTSYILKDTPIIDIIRTFRDNLSHLQLVLMSVQGLEKALGY